MRDNFVSLLEELYGQLLWASIHFEIWEALYPTTQVVNVINRYRGFFRPTREAHLDRLFIKICNVVSTKSSQPSFYQVFKMLSENTTLAPTLNTRSYKKRINSHRKTLKAIRDYRNERAAHWDTSTLSEEREPILFGECRRMLEELQNIFNEISGATTNKTRSFKPTQHGDTIALVNHLNEIRDIHQKKIEDLASK